MANALFDYGRNRFAMGEIRWKSSGGDTIRAFLVDSDFYVPDVAAHEFLSDIPAAARCGNSGGSARSDAPSLSLSDPVAGVCDAADLIFTTPPAGKRYEYIVIFKDDGAGDSGSPLIALYDTAVGLPVTTNGANITIQWDNGVNKIFKL